MSRTQLLNDTLLVAILWNQSRNFNDLLNDLRNAWNRHLRLAVWTQPPNITILAYISQFLSRRVVIVCLITRVPELPTSRSFLLALTPPAMSGLCTLIWIPLHNLDNSISCCHACSVRQRTELAYLLHSPNHMVMIFDLFGLVLISVILCLLHHPINSDCESSLLDSGCKGSAILHDVRHHASFTIFSIVLQFLFVLQHASIISGSCHRSTSSSTTLSITSCSRTHATPQCSLQRRSSTPPRVACGGRSLHVISLVLGMQILTSALICAALRARPAYIVNLLFTIVFC